MTVKISKPAINVREELADLRKPTGIAGEAMLRAETAQEQFNLIGAGRRNLIINGGMDVWQRATSHTTASGYRSVDRWAFNTYTGGAFTVSKEVDSVHGNYLKWNRTTTDTAHTNSGNCIQQSIENAQYVIGDQYVTVSFWLKDEAGLGSGFVRIRQAASPYSYITASNQNEYWYSSSTDWEYHTFTFKIKSAADIAMSNVQLQIRLDSGSALGGVSIAKVQLELGKVATPFEHRSYGEELALCQRYYQISRATSGATYKRFGRGGNVSTTLAEVTCFLPVEMRAFPSVDTTNSASDYAVYHGSTVTACSVIPALNTAADDGAGNVMTLGCTVSSGLTVGQASALLANNSATCFLAFKSEL